MESASEFDQAVIAHLETTNLDAATGIRSAVTDIQSMSPTNVAREEDVAADPDDKAAVRTVGMRLKPGSLNRLGAGDNWHGRYEAHRGPLKVYIESKDQILEKRADGRITLRSEFAKKTVQLAVLEVDGEE